MKIRLFEKDGSELWSNDEPIVKIVDSFAVWSDETFPTDEAESGEFYAIYAAPAKKVGKAAWKIDGDTRLVATDINGDEDIAAIVAGVTKDDIKKAEIIT